MTGLGATLSSGRKCTWQRREECCRYKNPIDVQSFATGILGTLMPSYDKAVLNYKNIGLKTLTVLCGRIYTHVMHKVRLGTIRRLSCTNLGSELCIANLCIVKVYAHTLLDGFTCTLIEQWPIMRHSTLCKKNFLSTKKIKNKVPRRNRQRKRMKSFLSGAIPATDALNAPCVLLLTHD